MSVPPTDRMNKPASTDCRSSQDLGSRNSKNSKRDRLEPGTQFQCPVEGCSYKKDNIASLKQHITQVHCGRCDQCGLKLNMCMAMEPWVDETKFRLQKGRRIFSDKNLKDVEMLREQHLNGRCSPGMVTIRGGEGNILLLTRAQHDSWVHGSKDARGDTQRSKEKALTDMSYEGIWKLIRGCSPPPHPVADRAAAGQMRQANGFSSGYSLDEEPGEIDFSKVQEKIGSTLDKPPAEKSDSGYDSARGAGGANPTGGSAGAEDKQQQKEKNPPPPPVQQPPLWLLPCDTQDCTDSNNLDMSVKHTGGKFGPFEAFLHYEPVKLDDTQEEWQLQ